MKMTRRRVAMHLSCCIITCLFVSACAALPPYQCPTLTRPVYVGPARAVGTNTLLNDTTALGTLDAGEFIHTESLLGPLVYSYITWTSSIRTPELPYQRVLQRDSLLFVSRVSINVSEMIGGIPAVIYNQQRNEIRTHGMISKWSR